MVGRFGSTVGGAESAAQGVECSLELEPERYDTAWLAWSKRIARRSAHERPRLQRKENLVTVNEVRLRIELDPRLVRTSEDLEGFDI